jgi:diguanylate cyclase (GGDEF)-like protein
VTLRARLTAAFLAVVLGPVVLGAVFVGITVGAVGAERSSRRLDSAATSVRAAVGMLCQRLQLAAETTALLAAGGDRAGAAQQVVNRGLAAGVEARRADGTVTAAAGMIPPQPWVSCASSGRGAAVSASVEVRDAQSRPVGSVSAVEPIDAALLGRLSDAAGVRVTAIAPDVSSTAEDEAVIETARALKPDATGTAPGGRLVRRVDPQPGQPFTLALSVPGDDPQGLYAALVAIVLCAGLVAVSVAWWLARSTTHPLTELAHAVERVADGDLSARVPVRSLDEVGRLGGTFNRMAREMQGYVQALTASRDQLRGQLGVLGDTLSSTHDLHRILQVILQTAMAATGAQSGVVLLVDPVSGALVGQVGEGLPEVDVPELRVGLGEGLLGAVAASGEPLRGRVDRDGPPLSSAEPRCLTYVAVPFAAPGAGPTTGLEPPTDGPPAARGVLALYNRHGFDEFDDADLVTLRTFAGQAAVAVDNVRVHEEAQRLSLTDPLTGLSNYRYLRESLRREIERATRFGRTLAVLVLDLDHFKDINDTHGHAAGDAVLAEFARRLRAEIREVDFAFRQGGEEFVILLPETDTTGGTVVAQRLGTAVRRAPVIVVSSGLAGEPKQIPVTVSIGIAVFPEHGATGPAVLEAADEALYAAKAAGRDTFQVAVTAGAIGASRGAQPPRQSRGG